MISDNFTSGLLSWLERGGTIIKLHSILRLEGESDSLSQWRRLGRERKQRAVKEVETEAEKSLWWNCGRTGWYICWSLARLCNTFSSFFKLNYTKSFPWQKKGNMNSSLKKHILHICPMCSSVSHGDNLQIGMWFYIYIHILCDTFIMYKNKYLCKTAFRMWWSHMQV